MIAQEVLRNELASFKSETQVKPARISLLSQCIGHARRNGVITDLGNSTMSKEGSGSVPLDGCWFRSCAPWKACMNLVFSNFANTSSVGCRGSTSLSRSTR